LATTLHGALAIQGINFTEEQTRKKKRLREHKKIKRVKLSKQ
jgi:hypothetical protein